MTTAYELSKAAKQRAERECTAKGDALTVTRNLLMIRLGVEPLANGLTPDVVKFHPAYRAAKLEYDTAFRALQKRNQAHVREFKLEMRAERRAVKDSLAIKD